jgi:hypothetical protein
MERNLWLKPTMTIGKILAAGRRSNRLSLLLLIFLVLNLAHSFAVRREYLPFHRYKGSMSAASSQETSATAVSQENLLLDQVLEVAIEASKKAGAIIMGNAGGAEVTEWKANSRDLLTLIDPLCEKVRQSSRIDRSIDRPMGWLFHDVKCPLTPYYPFLGNPRDSLEKVSKSRFSR